MSSGDILGLVLTYASVFLVLISVEKFRKKFNWPQYLTRKIVHIAGGMWIWVILYFFDHWYMGLIPFGSFIVLNYIFHKKHTFKSIDDKGSTPGTIYFSFSITLLLLLFWRTDGSPDRAPIAVAAIMAMTWGDALACLIGERWGTRRLKVFGNGFTFEGSMAMFVFSFISMTLTLAFLSNSTLSSLSPPMNLTQAAVHAFIAATVALTAEMLSSGGTDNLTVPLLTGLTLWILSVL
ncbi:MAG: diacylglycerol/polyprenol kinase family protein [Calditrichaceae bacterium]